MIPKSSAMKRGFSLRVASPDVAGVRIGMEEIVAEHLLVEQAHALGRQPLAVVPASSSLAMSSDGMPRRAPASSRARRCATRSLPAAYRLRQIRSSCGAAAGVAGLALQVSSAPGCSRSGHDLARADLVGAGMVRSTMPATLFSRAMSAAICWSMPGRSTLTTTSRPPGKVAACTCAIEAGASGVVSEALVGVAHAAAAPAPPARACSPSNGATRSCRWVSSSAMSGGTRSRRVEGSART